MPVILAAATCVVVSGLAFAYWAGLARFETSRRLAQENAAIYALEAFLSTMKDAETGQRGFLLTGKDQYLAPYNKALADASTELAQLRHMASAQLLPESTVASLARLSEEKLNELKATITLRRNQGLPAAISAVDTDRGKASMDKLRSGVAAIEAQKQDSVEELRRRNNQLTTARTAVWTVTAMLDLGFLFWAFRKISSEVRQKSVAMDEAVRQKDLVSVTLASIGDAVIVADQHGHVTFMNAVAEATTGWKTGEALGAPLAAVFNVVKDTVLIRRDRSEIPIDHSGAPIRGEDGSTRGVVLVFRDVAERKKAEDQLARAKRDAEAASRAKSEFLANMSHEIRTPLTAIMGFADLLVRRDASDVERLSYGRSIHKAGKHLSQIIDDILDLSRIEARKVTLREQRCSLPSIVAEVASVLGAKSRERSLAFEISCRGPVPETIETDPVRLRQILFNVIGNAVKFTAKGGVRVVISAAAASRDGEGMLAFLVADTGKGIDAKVIGGLFQPFSQGDSSTTREYGGTGLGLALSKRLAQALGGDLELVSSTPGVGSTFRITIKTEVSEGSFLDQRREPSADADAPPAEALGQERLKGLQVLLAEDAPDNQFLISRILRNYGAEVTICENGKVAIDLSREKPYDVVVMDLQMPVCDGYTATSVIRRNGYTRPIIALSAAAMEEDRDQALAAGCNTHVSKPIKVGELLRAIEDLLGTQNAEV